MARRYDYARIRCLVRFVVYSRKGLTSHLPGKMLLKEAVFPGVWQNQF